MALISTKGKITSDVIAYELYEEFGACRAMCESNTAVASATLASEDWVIGSVLVQTGGSGAFHLIDLDDVTADADLGDEILAVVIDPNVATAVDGDDVLCLLGDARKTYCGVRNLHYGDLGGAGIIVADARLKALGIFVEASITPTLS